MTFTKDIDYLMEWVSKERLTHIFGRAKNQMKKSASTGPFSVAIFRTLKRQLTGLAS